MGMHSVCCCCITIWRRSPLEKRPITDLFNAPPVMYASVIYVTGLVPYLVKALDFLLYKLQTRFPRRSLQLQLIIQFAHLGSPLEKVIDLFLANCPALDPPLGGVCQKAYTQVRDYEYFISIKFRKHPSSDSVGKADYVFHYIYISAPPPFLHLNKYIKKKLKIFKHLNLLYKPSPT